MILFRPFVFLAVSASILTGAPKTKVPTYTKVEEAVKETHYDLQGEYLSKDDSVSEALQVASLGDGQFRVLAYPMGLPGKVLEKQKIKIRNTDLSGLKTTLKDYKKVSRVSPTMGMKAPENAKIIFADGSGDGFVGKSIDGLMQAGATSSFDIGSFYMHLEFKLPYKPKRLPSNQDRGNSGVYIFNRYEVQVLDTFGLDLDEANNPGKMESIKEQWCGSLYKKKVTDINMAFPPLQWQTYEIDFTAPEIDESGKKVKNARITVWHNGVKIHDDYELDKGTGAGGKRQEVAREKIYFQNHGNPTEYRNIWIVEK